MHSKPSALPFSRLSLSAHPTQLNEDSSPELQLLYRLLNRIILGLFVLAGFALLTSFQNNWFWLTTGDGLAVSTGMILWLIAYFINRSGHTRQAGLLLALSITLTILILVVSSNDPSAIYITYYLILPVMLSNLFSSFRVALIFYGSHLLLMLMIPVVAPFIDFWDLPVIFYLLIGGVALFTRRYRILIETARKTEEQRYKLLFESIYDPVVVYEDGVYREVNAAFETMFNVRREQVIGKSIMEYAIPVPDYDDNPPAAYSGMVEVIARRGDNVTFPAEIHVHNYHHDNHILHVATVRDLTERKTAAEQTQALALERERVQLMRRFINDVSHDLRTPLTVIMTGLYMVKNAKSEADRSRRIETLEMHIQKIGLMLENMLTVARLEKAASDTFEFQMDNLNQIVQDCYQEQQYTADHKAIQMQFTPDDSLPLMLVDKKELHRGLRQLFINAIHYTPTDGKIDVRVSHTGTSGIFEITDTGIGIAPDKLKYIFELFYRVDDARGIDTGGMGMGLAICQRIIEGHKGKIEVESIVGQGTTFRVSLPFIRPDIPSGVTSQ
ncbi:MAG TPA: ATP-binding protein [Phototrophicaceae bacterium]|jgi:PAS domain S-box-containing protein|nr:ATP-binding protein [Phototrophicaceae bacterium]